MCTLDNITKLLKINKKTQKDLTDFLGITKNSFTNWKNGHNKSYMKYLPQIATFFNCSVDQLLGKDPQIPVIPTKKGVKIPVLGNVAAGIPIDAVEDVIDYEEIPEEMAKNGEYFGLRIDGDSMSPRIEKGDVVIVRKQSTVDNGNIAIVLINGGQASCKKVKFEDNGLMLISFNPAYEPMFFTKEECQTKPVQILGKVVELRGKF